MRLYDTRRSGNAWKVRLLASLIGRKLDRVTLSIDRGDLRSAAFVARNPLGQVPVLEVEAGSFIAESIAILHYLAQGTPWWPDCALDQAHTLTWLSFEQTQHMKPLAQLRLWLALHPGRAVRDGDLARAQGEAHRALALLDEQLRRQGPGAWVATRLHPSIADVALYPYTRLSPMGGIDLRRYPQILTWLARVEALPGYEPLVPGRPDLNEITDEDDA